MSLIGPRKVVALHAEDDHDRFVGRSLMEVLDQRAVLLGRVIELEVEKIVAECGRPVSDRERRLIEDEARFAWSRKAAGVGERASYEHLRDLGRGDQ